jgi:rhodanese-related sulfurtransferase
MKNQIPAFAALSVALAGAAAAQDQSPTIQAEFIFNGQQVSITRDAAQAPALVDRVSQNATSCAESCLAPAQAAPVIDTWGEREVLDFLLDAVSTNTGLLVDARMPETRTSGHIPGSVSLPYETLEPSNGFRTDILVALGAQTTATGLDFAPARRLVIYDAGPTQDDAGTLVRHLLDAGYPAEKIRYYRGGMLMWAALGLSVQTGSNS